MSMFADKRIFPPPPPTTTTLLSPWLSKRRTGRAHVRPRGKHGDPPPPPRRACRHAAKKECRALTKNKRGFAPSLARLRFSVEAQVPKMREKDGITSHESSRSLISLCVDVVRALQTLCGLGCLEKEEKVVTYDQSEWVTRGKAARRPQKQLRKNRQILQLLMKRSGGGEMIWTRLTDGQRKTQGQGRERDEICNWEEMPAEKSSSTECECARPSTRPSGSVCENRRKNDDLSCILRRHSTVDSR